MTEHGDQLRNAFETHEHLAPDAAAVYGRVQELSRSYQRRRWGVQAGGAVLGVSLIAGAAITLPGLLPGEQKQSSVGAGAATMPNMKPSAPAASPAQTDEDKAYLAYFAAGYDYDDAVTLAKLWKSTDEPGAIKIEAGRKLLAGETLPIRATPDDPETGTPDISAKDQKRLNAYFAAGYNWDDAVKLAKIWKLAEPGAAKVEGGKRILAREKLPVKP